MLESLRSLSPGFVLSKLIDTLHVPSASHIADFATGKTFRVFVSVMKGSQGLDLFATFMIMTSNPAADDDEHDPTDEDSSNEYKPEYSEEFSESD